MEEEPKPKKLKIDSGSQQEGSSRTENVALPEERSTESSEKPKRTRNEKFSFSPHGVNASLRKPKQHRAPVSMRDITNFVCFCKHGKYPTSSNRWVETKQTVKKCLILNVKSSSIKSEHIEAEFQEKHILCGASSSKSGSITKETLLSALILSEQKNILLKYGSIDLALREEVNHVSGLQEEFSIEDSSFEQENIYNTNDKIDRRKLMLSFDEMKNFNIPLPSLYRDKDFKLSKSSYQKVSSSSPLLAVDCEMVFTEANVLELAEIAIVDENLKTVYHKLVKPKNKILNYLTKYSGITEEKLKDVTTTLEDVQNDLIQLLPNNCILVGHDIASDLRALKLLHPYIIDTSLIFNDSGNLKTKPGLKKLAAKHLGNAIQESSKGHCPIEDAGASLKLVQLKLQKDFIYGNLAYQKLMKMPSQQSVVKSPVTSSVIGVKAITDKYCKMLEAMFQNKKVTLGHGSSTSCRSDQLFQNLKIITRDTSHEVVEEMCHCVTKDYLVVGNALCEEVDTLTDTLRKWEESIFKASPAGTVIILVITDTENQETERLILLEMKE